MRRRWLYLLAFAVGTAAAVAAMEHLPLPSRLFAAFLLVPFPALMHWQARASQGAEAVPRSGLYLSSALLLIALAALTGGVAAASHVTPAELGVRPLAPAPLAGWTLGAYAAGVAILVLGRLLHMAETPLLRHLIPVTRLEKLGFSALSITAGFSEELVFRGFLLWALLQATGSVTLAVAASSVVFGMLHAYQDAGGAVRATVLGAVLAAPVIITGSVVPAMIAHAAIDITSGLFLARWLMR